MHAQREEISLLQVYLNYIYSWSVDGFGTGQTSSAALTQCVHEAVEERECWRYQEMPSHSHELL